MKARPLNQTCSGIAKKPIFYIILFSLFLFSLGITWGLPHTETWYPDSLAPFHPLLGLGQMFSFGYFNKYPLVHQVILAVVNLPVLIATAINSADSYGLDILYFITLIRSESYATALMLLDNMVSVLMGAGIVYLVYRCCELLFGERTALFAALIVSLNAALNLHAHLAKVDVPYLFWGIMGIYYLIRIIKFDQKRDYILCAVMICLSFGSKDQGYAIFVLPLIAYLLFYQKKYSYDDIGYKEYLVNKNLRSFFIALFIGAIVVENVLLNPTGLIARYKHLTGIGTTASISYTMDFFGITKLLYVTGSIINGSVMGAPFFMISLAGIGLLVYVGWSDKKKLLLNIIFLTGAASYYIFFIQVARQNAYRFMLPISVFLSIYGGFCANFIYERLPRKLLIWFYLALSACCIYSFYLTFSINYNLLSDVRYKAEEWMSGNIPEGSKIEYYSYLHYLPRFPKNSESYRIKEEVASVETRRPDYIVLTSSYDYRFIGNPGIKLPKGFKIPDGMLKLQKDYGTFYSDLFRNKMNYRAAALFTHDPWIFKELRLFRIVPHRIIVFKRLDPDQRTVGHTKTYDPSILLGE